MGRKKIYREATINIKKLLSGEYDLNTIPIEGAVDNIQYIKKDPRGRKRKRVVPVVGGFYSGSYEAISPIKVIKVYDSVPIFYVLDKGKTDKGEYVLVVNFNWIPQKYRKKAIDIMISHGGGKSLLKTGKRLSFGYGHIKTKVKPNKYFYKIIRMYYTDKLSNVIKIPNKVIHDNIQYNEKDIVGSSMSAQQMLKIYDKYVK